jgi:hypothetical protein
MESIGTAFGGLNGIWGDAAGHVSYLIIAISYWLTNIYWLRVTAVVGLCFEVAYFVIMSDALYTGIAWDCVFIAINLLHLILLTRDRWRLRSAAGDIDLLRAMFDGLDDAQIGLLLKCADWRNFESGAALTQEGQPVEAVMMVSDGQASVTVGGRVVAYISRGTFVGEMAFLTGLPASATVTALQSCRALCLDQSRLKMLLLNDHQIAAVMHRLLGADLVHKLRAKNEAPAPALAARL